MDKKYNGFNNGRDRSDGVGGREVNHGKQETMTKEQIIKRELNGEEIEFFGDNMGNLFDCMEIYKDKQLSAELERAGKLVEALKYAQTKFYENSIVYNSIKQTLNEYDTATKES